MSKKLFSKFFVLLLVVGLLFAVAPTGQAQAADIPVACLGTDDTALLQGAITGANDGDVILVSGTCALTANITVSKDVTLDGRGAAKIQVSGTGDRITMTTAGATLQGFDIEKTDKTGVQNIIYINASNITLANNKIHGQFVIGDSEVSRAFITSGGNTGLSITGNEFWALRQPAYISGVITGTITNNYTHGTKGWVLEQGDLTFTNNTWGTVALGNPNVYDIAILSGVNAAYYTDVPAMSAANNNAFIEDQRYSPARLTPVYVDASAPSCTDCGTARMPYQTIQAGITRVIAGGTVNVAAGIYDVPTTITLDKAISIIGPTSGEAKLIRTDGSVTNNIFLITTSNVTIQRLTLTLAGAPIKSDAFIQANTVAKTNVQILNNKIYVEEQTGPMSGWQAQGIYFGGSTRDSQIIGNTIYNTRGGAIAHYNCEVEYRDNDIYNTKGGIMNYASSAANALERVIVNNSWGTVHNEWDIVWNSGGGPFDLDEIDLVLELSQENNDAYVVSQMPTAYTTPPQLIYGNRSHVFVNAVTGTETIGNSNGNINLPYKKIQDAIDAVVPGGKVIVAAGTYEGFNTVGKDNITITGAGDAATIIAPTALINTGVGHKYTPSMLASVFVNNSTGITIQGMAIKSTTAAPGSGGADAIVFWNNSTGSIKESIVQGLYTINGAQTGQGIAVDGGTSVLSLINTDISGFNKNAIDVVDGNGGTTVPGNLTVNVSGGTITGAGPITATAQNGISYFSRAGGALGGSITGATISGFDYTPTTNSATGILAYSLGGGTLTVSGNTFGVSEVSMTDVTGTLNLNAILLANIFPAGSAVVDDSIMIPPPVHNVTQGTWYSTIQGAIDAATDGNLIEVGPGTYNEAVIINKPNLTIRSTAGAATTIIDVPFGTLTTGVKVLANMGVVTFDGFTVKNFTEGGIIQGMAARPGTTFHVLNNIVLPYEPLSGVPYLRNGIQVSGDGSTVKGNYVNGAYLTNDWSSTAILVVNASNVEVSGNTISGEEFGLDYGIGVANWDTGAMTNILIKNNIVDHADYSLDVTAYSGTISGVVIEYNKVTNYIEPLWAGISGGVSVSQVDASPNWWGDPLGPQGAVTGDVSYKPWCANAACTEFLPAMATIAPVAPIVCGVTPTTTIDVNISGIPTGMIAQGYQLTLHFNPAKTSIASVDDIAQGGFLPLSTGFTVRTIDNVNGTVVIASTIFGTASNDPSKPLAKITLTHLGVTGDIALSLSDVLLSDADGQPIPADVSPTPVVLTLQPAVMNTTKSLGYCDLASAVAGATAGDNIQLLADITIPATVTVDKALTLDLNAKVATYTSGTDNTFAIKVTGSGNTLTVVDGASGGGGKLSVLDGDGGTLEAGQLDGRGIEVLNGASFVLQSGTIEAAYAGVYVRPTSSMTMNGGTISSPLGYGVIVFGNGTAGSASLAITGGTIDVAAFAVSGNGSSGYGGTNIAISGGSLTSDNTGIYHPQDGTLTISGTASISGYNGIEMKAGNLSVTGGTILGTGAFADPLPNDNGSANTGDAILLNGRDAYTGDITVTISGTPTITSTNAYALRDYKPADQALKTSAVLVSGGSFTGGIQAVTFSDAFVALPRSSTAGLMLTGGFYNTDPADPNVYVFVPYGTVYNGTVSMYEIVGISLNVHDFYYNNGGTLRGVSTDFYATNFLFSEASSVVVRLYSGVEGAYVLQQTNVLKDPFEHTSDVLTSSFDYFGTYVSSHWTNTKAAEFDPTLAPTRVEVTVVLPGGTLEGWMNGPTGDRATILPGVNGLVTLQGILAPRAGVGITLTPVSGITRTTSSNEMTGINYWFTGVETLTYTFTTSQPRYLNVTTASGKTFLVNRDLTLNPLRLYGGDVNQDNAITVSDASAVGTAWGSTANPDANINYDGIVNIQDLALVGGNYGLISATAYSWVP